MDRIEGDKTMVVVTILLVMVGLVMIYSASAVLASRRHGDSLFFFRRQILWAVIGVGGMLLAAFIPYSVWERAALPLILATVAVLVFVLIPGIGVEVNGSRRWLKWGAMTVQPSELSRLCIVIYLARYLSRHRDRLNDLFRGFLPPMVVVGVVMALIMGESDLGTAAVMGMVAGLMLFIGGARWRHLWLMALLAAPVMVAMIMKIGYRRERMTAFLDPWLDPSDSGFQMVQSFLALGNGGLFGVGLGQSHQKLFFLPYPHTDFIFAVIGEELGMMGTSMIAVGFGVLLVRGLLISLRVPDLFGRYLAFGLTLMVSLQAFINMAVVTGLLPTKGLTLPFLSYGGSSLLANLAAIGILWNISKEAAGRGGIASPERAAIRGAKRSVKRRTLSRNGGRGMRLEACV